MRSGPLSRDEVFTVESIFELHSSCVEQESKYKKNILKHAQ